MQSKKKLREVTGIKILYFTFGLRMTVSLITSSLLYDKYENILNPLLTMCNLIVIVFLILIITFFQTYSIKEIIIVGILTVIFQVASFKSGQGFIILSWLFICASKNIDLKIVAKETIIVSVFVIFVLIGLTGIGLIEISTLSRENGALRYSIGYNNPNSLGYIVLQIIVAVTLKKSNNYTMYDFLTLFLGFIFSFNVLNCRSVSICICLLGAFIILFRNQSYNKLRYLGIVVVVLAPICSIYLSMIYNSQNSGLYVLDKILSWRVTYANQYIEKYGFSIMGYDMDLTLLGALDNAYVRAAIFYGLVPLGIYIYGLVQLFLCEDNSKKIEMICIMVLTVYGLMEATIFIINCNFILLILAKVLYKKHAKYWKRLIICKEIVEET